MDDIAGLKWTQNAPNGQKANSSNYSAFSALKPTPPNSGRASPFNAPTSQPASKPVTPANDSFANLVSFGPTSNKNLSLLEQQKRLAEARSRQQEIQKQTAKDQFAGGDDQFWNNLGSGSGSPAVDSSRNGTTDSKTNALNDDDDDLFAVFNKPSANKSPAVSIQSSHNVSNGDDDDLFGLSEIAKRKTVSRTPTAAALDDDDDVLGLLGQPTSAHAKAELPSAAVKDGTPDLHPQDKAVAELDDMGFPADKARLALETTESGTDVQAAVGYLLNQAHAESRQRTQSTEPSRQGGGENITRRGRPESQTSRPSMRSEEEHDPRRRHQSAAAAGEKDFEHMASEFGSNFLKTAGSLWKQGTKRVQQAVQELNADGEPSGQPRWMREPERSSRAESQDSSSMGRPRRRSPEPRRQSNMTDEALMLEARRPEQPPRPPVSSKADHSSTLPSRPREPLHQKQPAFLKQQNPDFARRSPSSLNKAAAEEQAAQAYVSSARRRKPQPGLQAPVSATEPDLLRGSLSSTVSPPTTLPTKAPPPRTQSQPVRRADTPVRPPAPTRNIPSISAISLKACHLHREQGNEHFKRGDYSSAHQSYATSISQLPDTHPLVIVLLTNRALTGLKVGEPKTAISDADKAIMVIGQSKGESETIDFGNGESPKPMRDYYGKALMRKAEALEQLEKWSEAALVWREAVEGGHGGATSIQGRMRAEKAANPQVSRPRPKPKPASASAPPATVRRSAVPASGSTGTAAAVTRLRAANLAAEQADDEKFRLGDSVDARVQAWKGGKADNLRALLGSLDDVLWEGSGWKKISMADLVLPGKVKVQYMKGIAKVHPDKIPTDATTEQRMIAGAVFSTLNDAWDKFKAQNGM